MKKKNKKKKNQKIQKQIQIMLVHQVQDKIKMKQVIQIKMLKESHLAIIIFQTIIKKPLKIEFNINKVLVNLNEMIIKQCIVMLN